MSRLSLTLGISAAALLAALGGYRLGIQHAVPTAASSLAASPVKAEKKILYYRNPMGLPDTSPTPKQDSMGMDYVAVYEGEDSASGTVTLSPEKIQLLGVRSEAAKLGTLARSLRATGVLEIDERKQHWVAPRFAGWVQQLHVNQTGQTVAAGTPLLTLYSPELESTLREWQLAQDAGMSELAKSAQARLANWGIAPNDIASGGKLLLRAPIGGVVLEKMAIGGARFNAGDALFKLADLSSVWLQAEVAEQDQGLLRIGQKVALQVDAYPSEKFTGTVSFIAPVLNDKTRTVRVRIELPNPSGRLRPNMYASVSIAAPGRANVLTVPLNALIDSGTRQVLLVQVAEGRFQPREVQLGARNDERVEVLAGLGEGEAVVTRANFLIDAESNLRAALGGMGDAAALSNAPLVSSPDLLPPDKGGMGGLGRLGGVSGLIPSGAKSSVKTETPSNSPLSGGEPIADSTSSAHGGHHHAE